MSTSQKNFTIYFEIRNKTTGSVMLTKSFDCVVKLVSDSSVTGGTINGEEDSSFNASTDIFNGINENTTFDELIQFAKSSLDTFTIIFSIVPSFIWAFVAIGITICIILRIIGR